MKTVLMILVSMLLVYGAVITYIVVSTFGKEIAKCASDAWFFTLYLLRSVTYCYIDGVKLLNDTFEKKLEAIWNSIDNKLRSMVKSIDRLLMAIFVAYDYLTIESKPDLDLTENWSKLIAKPLSSSDVTNIYHKIILPTLTTKEKLLLADNLAINPNAVRTLLLRKGVIVQKHGNYYYSKRYATHQNNPSNGPTFEEECIAAVNDSNVIYINDAARIARVVLPKNKEDEMDMDEKMLRETMGYFYGLKFEEVTAEGYLHFNAIMADLCHVSSFELADPDDITYWCREILMDRIVNPYKSKHKICEYKELIFVKEPNHKYQGSQIPAFLDHSALDENSSIIFGGKRRLTLNMTEKEIEEAADKLLAQYRAEQKALDTSKEVAASIQE